MRIPISVQLAFLVLLTSLVGLAVISIATWVNNFQYVVAVKSKSLSLTASLKAGEIKSNLRILRATSATLATRALIQDALRTFNAANTSSPNWGAVIQDTQAAMGTGAYLPLYQGVIYSRDGQGNRHGLANITSANLPNITLPYTYPNGSAVMLGDAGLGYPPMLYPNLTYVQSAAPSNRSNPTTAVLAFPDFPMNSSQTLVLGPLEINSSFSLISFTVPIINNTSATDVLGFMTVVADGASLQSVLNSRDGLGRTGMVLLLGPSSPDNLFPFNATHTAPSVHRAALAGATARYVFVPAPSPGQANRHSRYDNNRGKPFPMTAYPAALAAFTNPGRMAYNATSNLSTKNEQNFSVAVGIARPQTSLVDWLLIVEETHAEAWSPVVQLRNIILACVFGTAGLIAILVFPLAHYSVTPIRRLKAATEKSIESSPMEDPNDIQPNARTEVVEPTVNDEKGNWILERMRFLRKANWQKAKSSSQMDGRQKPFRVPGKVRETRHVVTDELTELTRTFNEMADELMIQYTRLEERVAERTRELEQSKKAAEMANESKTLFIANISHELKTPLNGILGMCAVCMGEDDLPRIKKSLQVVYKSGDLLLHLLNDLLTFSRNQIDQAIRLDEKEFCLSDIRSQLATIFEKQVQEKHIHFGVSFVGVNNIPPGADAAVEAPGAKSRAALGPAGTASLKDMILWGDQHRILQILINLVSNSLKFTPEGGRVDVRIRCIGDAEKRPGSSAKGSVESSKRGSYLRSRTPSRTNSKSGDAGPSHGIFEPGSTAFGPHGIADGWRTPHPLNARTLSFEFEVEDTGPGIPENMRQRVFEPFVQGDLGLNRKYGGTGLGLSICAQLSRLMGGAIVLDSVEGKGTKFTLRMPLNYIKERSLSTRSSSLGSSARSSLSLEDPNNPMRSAGNGSPALGATSNGSLKSFEQDCQPRLVGLSQPFFAAAPPSSSGKSSSSVKLQSLDQVNSASSAGPGKIRVLVAEDNAVNQEVVLRMLKLEDIYDVTVAKDGQEAYDIVKVNMDEGKNFDLIFMDIQMPNLDGLQSTRLIRQMGYSAPIVALSALSEENNIKDCMDSGMNMFLSKPIRRPALKQVLNRFATIVEEPETLPQ